ncbi:hypothetical protein Rhal01_03716 [Rubritalea halochordaticola]|uniref:Uncharacterized protein n=1 Tax=Rubritalea halochordaticola TaxID=714537 RepID=A0ABP9V4H5_9BACT
MRLTVLPLFFVLLLSSFTSAAESKCAPVPLGEVRAWEQKIGDKGHKMLLRRWRIDEGTTIEERILMNLDGTCRSRVVATLKNRRPCMNVIYKGYSTPWLVEQYQYDAEGQETVTLRDAEGNVVATTITPADATAEVQHLDGNGKPMTMERTIKLANELSDLLFAQTHDYSTDTPDAKDQTP